MRRSTLLGLLTLLSPAALLVPFVWTARSGDLLPLAPQIFISLIVGLGALGAVLLPFGRLIRALFAFAYVVVMWLRCGFGC